MEHPVDLPETSHSGGATGSAGSGLGGGGAGGRGGSGGERDAASSAGGSDGVMRPDTPGAGETGDLHPDGGNAGDAASDAGKESPSNSCAACTTWGTPTALGPSPDALAELSGLAASRLHPGILYAHNDSGDSARFFAIDEQAHVRAEIHLSGVTAVDWEAISVGPCPTGSCIYIGDIGDNKLDRADYQIYRVAEPASLPSDGSVITVSHETFSYVYPSGAHYNAETLLVHPTTAQVFVILKDSGLPATVYELPLPLMSDAGQATAMVRVTTLALPPAEGAISDGSFHPCGDRILLRTTGLTGLFELSRTATQSLAALFGATPVMVPVASEPQGEAVTYALDGKRYFTASEMVSGSPDPSLSVVSCTN